MKICITGGGTGGHLMIAEVLAKAAVENGHELIFIGSTHGQDRKYFGDRSHFSNVYFLETTGVVNQNGFKKLLAFYKVIRGFFQARSLLKRHKIKAVYSVGGFSAAPASFASLSCLIPLFIHEQNAVYGRLNTLLKPLAKSFISAYDKESEIQGYPVKEIFYKRARVRSKLKTILFLGGSHGAKAINDLALSVAKDLYNAGIKILHQAGKADFERVSSAYKALDIEVELYSFTTELASLIEQADLAVSRAGASTLWELTTNGCPGFYVPYPYAAGDHQYYNAAFIVENKMGWCVREGDALQVKLLEALTKLNLEEKSKKLIAHANRDVATKMIQALEKRVYNAS